VAEELSAHPTGDVATLCEPITDGETLFDPAAVKVVMDKNGFALYFSRAPIPWDRDRFVSQPGSPPMEPDAGVYESLYYRHIGLYAYRASFLRHYVTRPHCSLEKVEALEQLRVLYDGGRIHVAEAREEAGFGIDTPADLMRVRRVFGQGACA